MPKVIYLSTSAAGGPPTLITYPTVSGAGTTGSVSTVIDPGTYGGTVTTITYQWYYYNVGGVVPVIIAGQTAATYTTLAADVTNLRRVFCRVTATGPGGSVTADSNYVRSNNGNPFQMAPASIFDPTFNYSIGNILNTQTGVWSSGSRSSTAWYNVSGGTILGSAGTTTRTISAANYGPSAIGGAYQFGEAYTNGVGTTNVNPNNTNGITPFFPLPIANCMMLQAIPTFSYLSLTVGSVVTVSSPTVFRPDGGMVNFNYNYTIWVDNIAYNPSDITIPTRTIRPRDRGQWMSCMVRAATNIPGTHSGQLITTTPIFVPL